MSEPTLHLCGCKEIPPYRWEHCILHATIYRDYEQKSANSLGYHYWGLTKENDIMYLKNYSSHPSDHWMSQANPNGLDRMFYAAKYFQEHGEWP